MKDFNNTKTAESFVNYYKEDSQNLFYKYFKRNNIVDLITKYELYYQISLGNFVFETFLDQEDTVKKLEELSLYIKPEIVLFNIYKIIELHKDDSNLEKELENFIKKDAALQALDDFIKKDKEFIGAKYYLKVKKEDILNDKFFNQLMQYNFESNYQRTYEHYKLIINDKFVENIPTLISKNSK